ncbi:LysR substrate binding domain protein [compost metagenome]
MELARQLAKRNLGVAFQTRIGIESDLANGELVHVPLRDNGGVLSDLGLYMRAERNLPVAVDAVSRLFAEEIARRESAELGKPAP